MPKPVQDAAAALQLARAYNIKGKIGLQLDETVVPVHILGALDELSDPYSATLEQVGGAGELASVLLDVQADSGVLVRVTDMWVTTAAPGGIEWTANIFPTLPNAGGATFARRRDSRMTDIGTTNVRVLGDSQIGGPGTPETFRGNPGPGRTLHVPITWWLTPGNQLWITCRTVAERVLVNFVWEQLPLTPSASLDK
jgi:hypothetical protein